MSKSDAERSGAPAAADNVIHAFAFICTCMHTFENDFIAGQL
jgi:hypothetical protein